jgi:hypothetical protein
VNDIINVIRGCVFCGRDDDSSPVLTRICLVRCICCIERKLLLITAFPVRVSPSFLVNPPANSASAATYTPTVGHCTGISDAHTSTIGQALTRTDRFVYVWF